MKQIKTIVLDPPWHFQGGGSRSINHKYSTMKYPAIEQLVCDTLENYDIADNAHCYIWVVNMHIDRGLSLMEAIGFKYITNICWVKNSMGMGYYFRGQHELCFFGMKGRGSQVRTKPKDIPSIIKAKKRKHSQKPEEFYTMVEKRSSGPYLELFSRHTRPGWQMWGNEIGKLDNE